MKQRHSYTNLMFHIVMRTKNREHFIDEQVERALKTFMKKKAHELDAWLEEFGAWYDHVHILIRTKPSILLSDVYGQLKGFATWSVRRKWPGRVFAWADGVYAVTVDPENCQALRSYIQNQRSHHNEGTIEPNWEIKDSP